MKCTLRLLLLDVNLVILKICSAINSLKIVFLDQAKERLINAFGCAEMAT